MRPFALIGGVIAGLFGWHIVAQRLAIRATGIGVHQTFFEITVGLLHGRGWGLVGHVHGLIALVGQLDSFAKALWVVLLSETVDV